MTVLRITCSRVFSTLYTAGRGPGAAAAADSGPAPGCCHDRITTELDWHNIERSARSALKQFLRPLPSPLNAQVNRTVLRATDATADTTRSPIGFVHSVAVRPHRLGESSSSQSSSAKFVSAAMPGAAITSGTGGVGGGPDSSSGVGGGPASTSA